MQSVIMDKTAQITLRTLQPEDYRQTRKTMLEAYHGASYEPWSQRDIERLIKMFPEGQLSIEVLRYIQGLGFRSSYVLRISKQSTAR